MPEALPVQDVVYAAILISDSSQKKLARLFDIKIPETLHCTIVYFGWKKDTNRSLCKVLPFGRHVLLTVDGIGEYQVNGIVKNAGFQISRISLDHILCFNQMPLADYIQNPPAHLTFYVAHDSKAVLTSKCTFHAIPPVEIDGVVCAFGKDGFADTVRW